MPVSVALGVFAVALLLVTLSTLFLADIAHHEPALRLFQPRHAIACNGEKSG